MENSASDVLVPPPETPPTFGAALRSFRVRSGLTQAELIQRATRRGRLSGMLVTSLSHWEDGRRVPLPPQLLAITKVLSLAPAEVLDLLALAAQKDRRYRGLLQSWASTSGTKTERIHAWEAWAITFPPRQPRGKSWRAA